MAKKHLHQTGVHGSSNVVWLPILIVGSKGFGTDCRMAEIKFAEPYECAVRPFQRLEAGDIFQGIPTAIPVPVVLTHIRRQNKRYVGLKKRRRMLRSRR